MTSNVTLATKDAFACVNAMFSSLLCHEPSQPPKPVAMAEPTVTISTKAAFAELNQMFSSDLPHRRQHTAPKQQGLLQPPVSHRAIGKGPAYHMAAEPQADFVKGAQVSKSPRAAHNGSGPRQAEVTGLGLYEDTCFLDSPKPAAGSGHAAADCDTQAFAIYEDTNFFGGQPADEGALADSENCNGHQDVQHRPGNGTAGFQMYEDTQCLAQKPTLPASKADVDEGLGIYEDTQFVQQTKQEAGPASSPGAFCIREDTQFVNQANAADAKLKTEPEPCDSPIGLGIYEDTQFVGEKNFGGTKAMSQAAAAKDEQVLEEVEDKENQMGPTKYVFNIIG